MTGKVVITDLQRYVTRSLRLMRARGDGNDDGMPPDLIARVDRLEKDVTEIKGDVKTLSGEVRVLSGEVKTISGDLKLLSGEVKTISADLKTLSGEVKTLSGDMMKHWADLAEVKGRVSLMPSTFQIQTWFVGVSIALTGMVFAIARLAK